MDRTAKATGPVDYDPCDGCPQPCRKACPVKAVRPRPPTSSSELGQSLLPGINGTYDRVTCNTKMSRDVEDAARALATSDEEGEDLASTMNAFEEAVMALPPAERRSRSTASSTAGCCELSCPVGR